jgi:hypothetical protein
MTPNEVVNAVLLAFNAWWMLSIFVGLCQPVQPRTRKQRGTWTQDEKSKS